MGVVNVTPDSFSDGGPFLDPDAAVAHGLRLVAEGADVIDVGGESTRPGSDPVPLEVELERVLPVIERLARETDIPISIDTVKAAVAERAIHAGAGSSTTSRRCATIRRWPGSSPRRACPCA